jgi:hypothetical protein
MACYLQIPLRSTVSLLYFMILYYMINKICFTNLAWICQLHHIDDTISLPLSEGSIVRVFQDVSLASRIAPHYAVKAPTHPSQFHLPSVLPRSSSGKVRKKCYPLISLLMLQYFRVVSFVRSYTVCPLPTCQPIPKPSQVPYLTPASSSAAPILAPVQSLLDHFSNIQR